MQIKKDNCFDREQFDKTEKFLKDRIMELTTSNIILVRKFKEEVAVRESFKVEKEHFEEGREQIMKQVETQTVDDYHTYSKRYKKIDEVRF